MKKITLSKLREDHKWKRAVIVFTEDSFRSHHAEIKRSYEISHNNKYFMSDMNGNSLFGNCLDGSDDDVRLDIYMTNTLEDGRIWKVDYCYIVDEDTDNNIEINDKVWINSKDGYKGKFGIVKEFSNRPPYNVGLEIEGVSKNVWFIKSDLIKHTNTEETQEMQEVASMNLKIQMMSLDLDKWNTICETNERFVNNVLDALYNTYKSREFRVLDANGNEVSYQ